MNDNECRIIKIDKDALYEFIYENFIANHEEFMDMDAVGNMNTFAINWETGEFIFCAHKDENEKGEIVKLKSGIDINLNASYNYSDQLVFFVELNNLAFQRYYEYYNYPSQRFVGLLGARFAF